MERQRAPPQQLIFSFSFLFFFLNPQRTVVRNPKSKWQQEVEKKTLLKVTSAGGTVAEIGFYLSATGESAIKSSQRM